MILTTAFVPQHVSAKLNCCYKEYISRTINPFCEYQNNVIKNFAVVMNAVIQRADCIYIHEHVKNQCSRCQVSCAPDKRRGNRDTLGAIFHISP